MKRVGTLEVDEDLAFTSRERVFERCGWAFLLLLLLAAAAGVFGSGPVSRKEAKTADGTVSVSYSRTLRQQSPNLIRIRFHRPDQEHVFGLSNSLLEAWTIQSITPAPDTATSQSGQTVFRFHGRGPGVIDIDYTPQTVGSVEGAIYFPPQGSLPIKQFTFP